MTVSHDNVRRHLARFDFPALFKHELGWDNLRMSRNVTVNGQHFLLDPVAEKHGVQIYHCAPSEGGKLPDQMLRRIIDQQLTKLSAEHLLIFTDAKKTIQVWQWTAREAGRARAYRSHFYYTGTSGDSLIQKLDQIAIPISDEENLTLTGVTIKLRDAFDREKLAKTFYDQFKKEHNEFLKFLRGIPDADLQRWYASVMINRLMFIYFIQAKGFLAENKKYLQSHLAKSDGRFYRDFLCPLFFEGFAKRESERDPQISARLGRIPYLNGGLFNKHQIEAQFGESIDIPDAAFEKIFKFFDTHDWHLDNRPVRNQKEINPDVLGYIFEKYVNQKQMGAYYTKEDITEYIGKNTIIPFLFNQIEKGVGTAFTGERTVWDRLAKSPDRYIYDAVKHGIYLEKDDDGEGGDEPAEKTLRPLPEHIAQGIDTVSLRGNWNTPADKEFALPTEIWREVVARRKRYAEVRDKLASGEVRDINDLITLNLNIRRFALDVVEQWEGSDLIKAVWDALNSVTILDPTCGSGAFLFAALEILEPLYEACLERMEAFVADADQLGHSNHYPDFRNAIAAIQRHPSRAYFIYKTIIVKNLYGVDIMEEATEICKLRLFLKLAAQVEPDTAAPNIGIEPLPDIDFNIRAGNTLVGFATEEQVRTAILGSGQLVMDMEDKWAEFERPLQEAQRKFEVFQSLQSEMELPSGILAKAKAELQDDLTALRDKLDFHLGIWYGKIGKTAYAEWRKSAQPFHWFIEFYKVIKGGGFDVIIGNPPFVEYAKVRATYQIRNFATESCADLYAFVVERSLSLLMEDRWIGVITPLASISVQKNESLRNHIRHKIGTVHVSSFGFRPAKLFEGVNLRLAIMVARKSSAHALTYCSTKYLLWNHEERENLFQTLTYCGPITTTKMQFLKLGSPISLSISQKIQETTGSAARIILSNSASILHYHRSPLYWIRAMDFEPFFKSDSKERSTDHFRDINVQDNAYLKFLGSIMNSNLFYFRFVSNGNCRNLTAEDVNEMPLGFPTELIISDCCSLFNNLMVDYKAKSDVTVRYNCSYQTFYPSKSKPIIDEIDRVLAKHYGFTEEELDFIINYDIKYRMGRNDSADD